MTSTFLGDLRRALTQSEHEKLVFAAMWHSGGWYEHWRTTGSLHAKARAVVLHDRVLNRRF